MQVEITKYEFEFTIDKLIIVHNNMLETDEGSPLMDDEAQWLTDVDEFLSTTSSGTIHLSLEDNKVLLNIEKALGL